MTEEEKWQTALKKIEEDTRNKRIVWKKPDLQDFRGRHGERIRFGPFIAEIQGRLMAVYEHEQRYWTSEDEFHWVDDVSIQLVKHDRSRDVLEAEIDIPNVPVRFTLLKTVRSQVVGLNSFLDDLLQ